MMMMMMTMCVCAHRATQTSLQYEQPAASASAAAAAARCQCPCQHCRDMSNCQCTNTITVPCSTQADASLFQRSVYTGWTPPAAPAAATSCSQQPPTGQVTATDVKTFLRFYVFYGLRFLFYQ